MKTIYGFLVALLLLSSAQVTAGISEADFQEVLEAAQKGRLAELNSKIKSEKIEGHQRFYLLKASLEKGCNPSIVDAILERSSGKFEEKIEEDSGSIITGKTATKPTVDHPGAILTRLAALRLCGPAIRSLSQRVSASDFSRGVGEPEPKQTDSHEEGDAEQDEAEVTKDSDSFLKQLHALMMEVDTTNKPATERAFDALKVISEKITQDCKDKIEFSCSAVEQFKAFQASLKGAADEEAHAASPAGIKERACKEFAAAADMQERINTEREKGKISGFVNASDLKRWGDKAYEHQRNIKSLAASYKKKTGKDLKIERECTAH